MQHIYTINPPDHQPQWPANDNRPEDSVSSKLIFWAGIAVFALFFVATIALGFQSMTVSP